MEAGAGAGEAATATGTAHPQSGAKPPQHLQPNAHGGKCDSAVPMAAILLSQTIVWASGGTKICRSAVPEAEVRAPVDGLPAIPPVRLPGRPVPESIDRSVTFGVPRGWASLLPRLQLAVREAHLSELEEPVDFFDARLVSVER
jgi:hypothetical protein